MSRGHAVSGSRQAFEHFRLDAVDAPQPPRAHGDALDELLLDGVGGLVSRALLREKGEIGRLISSKVTTFPARKPWRNAFRATFALPRSVFGPVLFSAFRRLAAIFASLPWQTPSVR